MSPPRLWATRRLRTPPRCFPTWCAHPKSCHGLFAPRLTRFPAPNRAQYGPIPPAAVTEETAVDRTPSGKFLGILWGIEVIHSRADWIKLSAS